MTTTSVLTPTATATWRAYLVRCTDGSLYAGVSTDVPARVAAHNAGQGARYTRARRPVALAWRSPPLTKVAAHRLEYRLKRLAVGDKRVLAAAPTPARRRLVRQLVHAVREKAVPAAAPTRAPKRAAQNPSD